MDPHTTGNQHDHHQGHSHGCHHGIHHHHHGASEKNILLAFVLNLVFVVIEVIGGIFTGSISILSDALHDFGDAMSLGMALYIERVSKRGRDRHFSYGYKRFSLLSALILSIMLIVGAFFVVHAAIERILSPSMPDTNGMIILAIIGFSINGFAAWRMSRGQSLSERAIRLHLMEDVLGWAAVLVVSIVMHFVEIPILDPLLSLGITGWMLYNVYLNLRDTFRILLQGVPAGVDTEAFEREVRAVAGILDMHDLHLWTLNGEENIASVHAVYVQTSSPEQIAELKDIIRHIALHHQIHHITIELDPEGHSCGMEDC